jgi:hypothetical protein
MTRHSRNGTGPPARANLRGPTEYITADMSADVALTKLIADPGPS